MQSCDRYYDSRACNVPISVVIVSSLLGSFIFFFFFGVYYTHLYFVTFCQLIETIIFLVQLQSRGYYLNKISEKQ